MPAMRDVDELVATVIEVAGKEIHIKHVDSPPVGVQSRNFNKARIKSSGWEVETSF